ncbi:hypothetical protein T484DRAFT_1925898, partial [Baffinella frigidus]
MIPTAASQPRHPHPSTPPTVPGRMHPSIPPKRLPEASPRRFPPRCHLASRAPSPRIHTKWTVRTTSLTCKRLFHPHVLPSLPPGTPSRTAAQADPHRPTLARRTRPGYQRCMRGGRHRMQGRGCAPCTRGKERGTASGLWR